MSASIAEFDKHTPIQVGENGHQEYTWASDVREKVLQLSFQLTRTSDVSGVEKQLRSLLIALSGPNSIVAESVCKELLIVLYKMIGHTRDIVDGKGECMLTHMMIFTWYEFYPELAKYALFSCVLSEMVEDATKKEHPYGSWKDIKYFCNFAKERGWSIDHPMMTYAFGLINAQLKVDVLSYEEKRYNDISLLCKWIARETSDKFGWMYSEFATEYFSNYLVTAKNPESKRKAINKAKMDYRKLIANINRALDTIQIKQCAGEWASINFDKTTSITFTKQRKAFLNVKNDGTQRFDRADRVKCSENFKEHVERAVNGKKEVKGKRCAMNLFTKQALALLSQPITNETQTEIDLLNSQWRDNANQNCALENFIPMVDVSGSMTEDNSNPLHTAVALGYRIAEKSTLGKRVMTFSATPTWVNLEKCAGFLNAVEVISSAPWGMNTNFYSALNMILDSCIEQKLPADDVEKMVLVVLSDMQIDSASNENIGSLYDVMEQKYSDAGIRAVGEPYKPPHILFWNLRSTNGFPSLSGQKNISMLSGFSPALLNLFCEKGMDSMHSCTPWAVLIECLNNSRYSRLENKALEVI